MYTTPKCKLQFPLAVMILYSTYVAENNYSIRGWLCIDLSSRNKKDYGSDKSIKKRKKIEAINANH